MSPVPRPPHAYVLVAMLLAACAPGAEGEAPTTTAQVMARPPSTVPRPLPDLMPAAADDDAASTSASGEGAWLLQETYPPRAVWGSPASEGQLAFSCDPMRGQLVLARHAVGVPADVRQLSIDADGTRVEYPAERREDALAPVLSTTIALDAPILDRMLVADRLVVAAGPDAIATGFPGPSLRAVVDACRDGQPG